MSNPHKTRIIVAALDLTDENQRYMHDCIERMHSGRNPTLRALAMRQKDGQIIEAVQWFPSLRNRLPPRYSIVIWDPAALSISWREMPTLEAAVSAVTGITAHLITDADKSTFLLT